MPSANKPSVLSVDGDEATRVLLRHVLEDDCEITAVGDPETALKAIEARTYDLLLLEIKLTPSTGQVPLPYEGNGVELLHKIRARDGMSDVPAIALTGHVTPGSQERVLDRGFNAYVPKPFVAARLRAVIKQVLPDRQSCTP